jgi:hypothetical protein
MQHFLNHCQGKQYRRPQQELTVSHRQQKKWKVTAIWVKIPACLKDNPIINHSKMTEHPEMYFCFKYSATIFASFSRGLHLEEVTQSDFTRLVCFDTFKTRVRLDSI